MLRRLRLTPLPLLEFATARAIFHLLIALVQAVILLTVGRILFGVHLVGNVMALVPLILIGGLSFIALGMCIGGRVNTEDATAALSNLIVLPMTFLGGVFFPLSAAPEPIRVIAHFLPLTYLAEGLQDVAVRGHSFTSTLPNLAVLTVFAAFLGGLALRLFRWETDTSAARARRIRGSGAARAGPDPARSEPGTDPTGARKSFRHAEYWSPAAEPRSARLARRELSATRKRAWLSKWLTGGQARYGRGQARHIPGQTPFVVRGVSQLG